MYYVFLNYHNDENTELSPLSVIKQSALLQTTVKSQVLEDGKQHPPPTPASCLVNYSFMTPPPHPMQLQKFNLNKQKANSDIVYTRRNNILGGGLLLLLWGIKCCFLSSTTCRLNWIHGHLKKYLEPFHQ